MKRRVSTEWLDAYYKRLDDLLKARGWSKCEFSRRYKLSRKTFYPQANFAPSVFTLILLADAFGVTTDYLLGREEKNSGKEE